MLKFPLFLSMELLYGRVEDGFVSNSRIMLSIVIWLDLRTCLDLFHNDIEVRSM